MKKKKRWVVTGWDTLAQGHPVIEYTLYLPVGMTAKIHKQTDGGWRFKIYSSGPAMVEPRTNSIGWRTPEIAAEEAEKLVKLDLEASLEML